MIKVKSWVGREPERRRRRLREVGRRREVGLGMTGLPLTTSSDGDSSYEKEFTVIVSCLQTKCSEEPEGRSSAS